MADHTLPLRSAYQAYIGSLNARNWRNLENFVAEEIQHNDTTYTLASFTSMLESFTTIAPDQHYDAVDVVVQPTEDEATSGYLAARILITVTPKETFLGFKPNGKTIKFWEYVFYWFRDGKMYKVRSLLDMEAVEQQMKV